ncbi:hypothetical protein PBI_MALAGASYROSE_73 [Mycobacterium phage MalagasyRose]|uniref:Uncharacterized protein n=1 Tax=Mycobacterium phage MalagasyRose TaxID=2599870 RepID=A0A5J6TDC4_9CAUD|nr:hypothetical protein QEH39_gp15 [Mycobacterium phage MalagasyRose]QFG08921.1 hypothetical protein PBI_MALAGASYROSE_73 [Mycobacterium phage MalagasyRose]
MNAAEITTAAANLPALPTVCAASMLHAQGYRPTTAERAAITARADLFAALNMPTTVNVPVLDFRGARIGTLEFHRS